MARGGFASLVTRTHASGSDRAGALHFGAHAEHWGLVLRTDGWRAQGNPAVAVSNRCCSAIGQYDQQPGNHNQRVASGPLTAATKWIRLKSMRSSKSQSSQCVGGISGPGSSWDAVASMARPVQVQRLDGSRVRAWCCCATDAKHFIKEKKRSMVASADTNPYNWHLLPHRECSLPDNTANGAQMCRPCARITCDWPLQSLVHWANWPPKQGLRLQPGPSTRRRSMSLWPYRPKHRHVGPATFALLMGPLTHCFAPLIAPRSEQGPSAPTTLAPGQCRTARSTFAAGHVSPSHAAQSLINFRLLLHRSLCDDCLLPVRSLPIADVRLGARPRTPTASHSAPNVTSTCDIWLRSRALVTRRTSRVVFAAQGIAML